METRTNKSGKRKYRDKFYSEGIRYLSPFFERKTDVKIWMRKKRAEIEQRKLLGQSYIEDITFNELSSRFFNSLSDLSPNTIRNYKNIYKVHLKPEFKNTMANKINRKKVENFKNMLISDKELSHKRANTILIVVNRIFKFGLENELIRSNPMANIKFYKITNKNIEYWTKEECRKFLKTVRDNHYYPLFVVALNTGMRLGELIALKWDCINFDDGHIHVKRNFNRFGLVEYTKSKVPRTIPMSNECRKALESLSCSRASQCDFVFTNPKGNHVSYEHFTHRVFKPLVKESGVKMIKFHDLRSTFATNFCSMGKNIFALSKILGHSSVKITESYYASFSKDYLQNEMMGFSI